MQVSGKMDSGSGQGVGVQVGYLGPCLAGSRTPESGASSALISVPSTPLTNHHQLKAPSPGAQSLWRAPPAAPTLTDALVHLRVAGVEVPGRAGWQADAHLANVVPLQQDEESGRALEAAVDLGAELTAFGTGLAPLGTDCKGVRRRLKERAPTFGPPQGREESGGVILQQEGASQAGSPRKGCFMNIPRILWPGTERGRLE